MSEEEKKEAVFSKLETNYTQEIKSFEGLELKDDLLRGVYGYGYEQPSKLQSLIIKPLILGKNVIAQAQAGTGKTGAYLISTLQKIDSQIQETQAIVLVPTRELAKSIFYLTKHLSNFLEINMYLAVGGQKLSEQKQILSEMKAPPQIVIGTPGRLLDLVNRKWINLDNLTVLILDEADELMDRGFSEQIVEIFQLIPKEVQCGLLSSTLSKKIIELTKKYMKDPAVVLLSQKQLTLEGIYQYYIQFDQKEEKFEILVKLLKKSTILQCIIFVNTNERAKDLTDKLESLNFVVAQINNDITYEESILTLKKFNAGIVGVLIINNFIQKGVNAYKQANLVINYDLPNDKYKYIQRIGNFISSVESNLLKELEIFYQIKIEELPADLERLFDDLSKK